MKCPKCSREFSEETSYCESCSVMLDPVEIEDVSPAEPAKAGDESFSGEIVSGDEKIEDVKIDSLKADIETKFVSTLLQEIAQLKKRAEKKEKALSELKNSESGMESSDFLLSAEKKGREIEEIIKKTEKLESILYNLKKKIEADISDLDLRLNAVQKPGIPEVFSENGKYYRMLSAELKTKKVLMDIVLGKKSPIYFKLRKLTTISSLVLFSVALSLLVSWYVFTLSYEDREMPSMQSSVLKLNSAGKLIIRERDITNLLEDIRKANLAKDINLWESRYSKHYLESGNKRENQLEQWKKFDFRALNYKVDGIKIQQDTAGSLITWEMELYLTDNKETKKISQRLSADFIIEDRRLKIGAVKKLGD